MEDATNIPHTNNDQILTIQELAERWNCTVKNIYFLLKTEEITCRQINLNSYEEDEKQVQAEYFEELEKYIKKDIYGDSKDMYGRPLKPRPSIPEELTYAEFVEEVIEYVLKKNIAEYLEFRLKEDIWPFEQKNSVYYQAAFEYYSRRKQENTPEIESLKPEHIPEAKAEFIGFMQEFEKRFRIFEKSVNIEKELKFKNTDYDNLFRVYNQHTGQKFSDEDQKNLIKLFRNQYFIKRKIEGTPSTLYKKHQHQIILTAKDLLENWPTKPT